MRRSLLILALALILPAAMEAQAQVRLCAVPQVYQAVESLKDISPLPYETFYAVPDDIYARVANSQDGKDSCDVVISSDERLPILLTRALKAVPGTMNAFIRAPLILWSQKPGLIDRKGGAASAKKLKSLALPKPSLTPVGYAAKLVAEKSSFPTRHLEGHIYRGEQEYQVYALVKDGHADAGFITKPLVVQENGRIEGSYWQVSREAYPDICYYVTLMDNASDKNAAEQFHGFISSNLKVREAFVRAGFEPLNDSADYNSGK